MPPLPPRFLRLVSPWLCKTASRGAITAARWPSLRRRRTHRRLAEPPRGRPLSLIPPTGRGWQVGDPLQGVVVQKAAAVRGGSEHLPGASPSSAAAAAAAPDHHFTGLS